MVADQLNMATYRPGLPYVLSMHNNESRLLDETPALSGTVRNLERRWDVVTLRARQADITRDPLAHVVVVSEGDAASLGVRATVVPNGTDIPRMVPPLRGDGDLLFVGSMTHFANVLGVRWWANEVWPELPAGTPPLTVVGRGGVDVLTDMVGRESVRIVGEVEDLGPHLARATAVVVPLRHGGGTRLKILEALAWGRPVVTTTKGAEGLPVRHGVHVLIADSPREFALAIQMVLLDSALRERLGRAGRLLTVSFDWEHIGTRFVDVVASVAAQSSGRG